MIGHIVGVWPTKCKTKAACAGGW